MLSDLGRYRWTVPILAFLVTHGGAGFGHMAGSLAIPRESLARTLKAAMAAGWVVRNAGRGAGARPDYVLTVEGVRVAEGCRALILSQAAAGLPPNALTRWGLPVIRLVASGNMRFNAIARALDGVTPRALTASLKALVNHDLLHRRVTDGFPPASDYALTGRGIMLAQALDQMAG
jgi:DNA-binding HxlR family transcriptional regulator